jgi:PAS domain S-box-containing protein
LSEQLLEGGAVKALVQDPARDRWIESRVSPLPDGGYAFFLRDITEWKRADHARRGSELRFSRYMENLPGLAWMKDLSGRYLFVNEAAARAFRHTREELYGRTDDELFPPGTASAFRENDRVALENGTGVLAVENLLQDDGVEHHSLVSKFPVADSDGRVIAVGGIAIDITERVHAEEALRTADRRKDEFLAMLAHELRNPLAPLVTAADILRMHGSTDPVLRRQQEVIHRQTQQMKRLLDDLLDVSRISRGKVQLAPEAVDLVTILTHAVEMSQPLIDARGHTLELGLPNTPLPLEGDPARLVQVFTNLLNNAAKFTPPGGRIRLQASQTDGAARVSVRDTGIGMTPEVLEHAFELFAQGDQELDRTRGGLGIGLTLVRQLAEMHGGSATAHSDGPKLGTEVVVTLPLRPSG